MINTYPQGTVVEVLWGASWWPAVVVAAPPAAELDWWPGVDMSRAVALRMSPGSGFPQAGRRPDFDLLIPDPSSPMLRPAPAGAGDVPAPRAILGVVGAP